MELQSDRPMGMALGPIRWFSVVKWAEINGLADIHDITVLNRYLRAMEAADREFEDKKENR